MSTIKIAVVVGVIAEAILLGAYSLFGQAGPCTFNSIAGLTMLFHLPGVLLSDFLFTDSGALATTFIVISGAVQFFLLTLIVLTVWKRSYERRPA